MSVLKRTIRLFRGKAEKKLKKAEDPRETLDFSYQRQLELLTKVRRGVAEVATSRKRVELQMVNLERQAMVLAGQAEKAVAINRDDLAREALTRKAGLKAQLAELTRQHDYLKGEEAKLVYAQQQLQLKVERFRTLKETIKASYTAAEAQARINEAVAGIGDELGDVGLALQRAEDQTQEMQARASALTELMASGALTDLTAPPSDTIAQELELMASTDEVESELNRLRNLGRKELG